MRDQIEILATRGAPTVSLLIEHADREVVWPVQNLRANVFNTGTPAIGYAEAPDTLAVLAWLHKDALIKRFDAEADDKAALSIEAREPQAAEIQGDLLAVERDKAALVWPALAQGLPTEHRSDCHPLAILGAELRTLPAGDAPRGSSPEHAGYNLIGTR